MAPNANMAPMYSGRTYSGTIDYKVNKIYKYTRAICCLSGRIRTKHFANDISFTIITRKNARVQKMSQYLSHCKTYGALKIWRDVIKVA